MSVTNGVLQVFVFLHLVPLCADAYSRGAGSCHTARDGHGEATAGDGGFVLSTSAAPTAGTTVTLRLAHAEGTVQFKGFLVKVTGPGGEYDGGGAAFRDLDRHGLAQGKQCYGPPTATHRSSDLKDVVELDLVLPQEAVELVATVIVMIHRTSRMDSQWYTWNERISVSAAQVSPALEAGLDPQAANTTAGSSAQLPNTETDPEVADLQTSSQTSRPLGARCLFGNIGPRCQSHLDCVLRPGVTCSEDTSVSCFGICSNPRNEHLQPPPLHVDPDRMDISQELTVDPAPSDLKAYQRSDGSKSTRCLPGLWLGSATVLLASATGWIY